MNAVGEALKVEDEEKLRYLTFTTATSTSSGKSTYATWSRFFMRGVAARVGLSLRRISLSVVLVCAPKRAVGRGSICVPVDDFAHEGGEAPTGSCITLYARPMSAWVMWLGPWADMT